MAKVFGLDTVLFIYLLEEHPKYLTKVERLFQQIHDGRDRGIFSCIGMIELLTGPKKQGREELAHQYRELLSTFPNLTIWGVSEQVVERASDLRAQYNIATPDAIHLATALDAGVDFFFTNDRRLLRVREVRVKII